MTLNYWMHGGLRDMLEKFHKTQVNCPECKKRVYVRDNLFVCPECGYHFPMPSNKWVEYLTSKHIGKQAIPNSKAKDVPESSHPRYAVKIKDSHKKTGFYDGMIVLDINIGKHNVILTILNPDFFNAAIGPLEAKRFIKAIKLAIKKKVPLVSVWTSAGMNMALDEALYKMPGVQAWLSQLKTAHINILSKYVLGGASVSFVQGDIIIAEPDSEFGFTGSKVVKQAHRIPDGFQTAEEALKCGKVDMVTERKDILNTLLNILDTINPANTSALQPIVFTPPEIPCRVTVSDEVYHDTVSPQPVDILARAQHRDRPTAQSYLPIFERFIQLRGDRVSEECPTIIGGLAMFCGRPTMVIAIERGRFIRKKGVVFSDEYLYYNGGAVKPAGFRKASRLIRLAEKLGLPITTILDTKGAAMDPESEQENIAAATGETTQTMVTAKCWTTAICIGEGGSGGYIVLGCTDRVLMLENAYIAVATPVAKADILYKDKTKAGVAANNSNITSADWQARGKIDAIVPEPGFGAHINPLTAVENVKEALKQEFANIPQKPPTQQQLLKRFARYAD